MSDVYAAAIAAPSEWIDGQPGLREALGRWASRPRRPETLVGDLHRPSPGYARGVIRRAAAMPAVAARWWQVRGRDDRPGNTTGRSPLDRIRNGMVDYLVIATATGSPGGRDLVDTLRAVRPDLLDGPALDIATPPAMARAAVERRLGPAIRSRLDELDDEPVSITEYDQVHRGRLDDGTPVAIAVARPGVARRLCDDARVLAPWLVAAETVDRSPWRDGLVEILRDGVAASVRRCDQIAVALDAVVLHTALEASSVDDLRVARPIPELVDRDSAAYVLPAGEHLQLRPSPSAVLAAGISTIAEASLVHGVYTTHPARDHLWADRHGITTIVGGSSIGVLRTSTRRALGQMLLGFGSGADPIDSLIDLGVLPAFANRDAVRRTLHTSGLANPVTLLAPGGTTSLREAGRELAIAHGARITPELVGVGFAVLRLVAAVRTDDQPSDPSELLKVMPRLAGIGSRIASAA